MTVQTIAREDVATVGVDATVAGVVEVMKDRNVGSVVVEDGGSPVGIVTDRDLAIDVLGEGLDPAAVGVREIMSADLFTVEAGTGLLDMLGQMGEVGLRRAPVVDDGELVGIVTLDDLIVLLSMELQSIANIIRAESPPYEVDATDLF